MDVSGDAWGWHGCSGEGEAKDRTFLELHKMDGPVVSRLRDGVSLLVEGMRGMRPFWG